jgi:hypothetical protein
MAEHRGRAQGFAHRGLEPIETRLHQRLHGERQLVAPFGRTANQLLQDQRIAAGSTHQLRASGGVGLGQHDRHDALRELGGERPEREAGQACLGPQLGVPAVDLRPRKGEDQKADVGAGQDPIHQLHGRGVEPLGILDHQHLWHVHRLRAHEALERHADACLHQLVVGPRCAQRLVVVVGEGDAD